MYPTLAQYTRIITTQSKALLHSNIINLNKTQRSAFRTINLHAEKLASTINSLNIRNDHLPMYITRQIANLVAPIQRYAELLTSKWVGNLNHDQSMHVEIILHSAIDLAELLEHQSADDSVGV